MPGVIHVRSYRIGSGFTQMEARICNSHNRIFGNFRLGVHLRSASWRRGAWTWRTSGNPYFVHTIAFILLLFSIFSPFQFYFNSIHNFITISPVQILQTLDCLDFKCGFAKYDSTSSGINASRFVQLFIVFFDNPFNCNHWIYQLLESE